MVLSELRRQYQLFRDEPQRRSQLTIGIEPSYSQNWRRHLLSSVSRENASGDQKDGSATLEFVLAESVSHVGRRSALRNRVLLLAPGRGFGATTSRDGRRLLPAFSGFRHRCIHHSLCEFRRDAVFLHHVSHCSPSYT